MPAQHAYATLDDVYQLGLTAQAFVVRPRAVLPADVDTSTGVIRLEAHGLTADDIITTRVTPGGTLATGLSAFVAYGVAAVSFDLLRITSSGVPFTSFASAGSGWSIAVDPIRRLERNLLNAAGDIDDKMTAYTPPFDVDPVTGTYPETLIGLNARLAAIRTVTTLQFENAAARVAVDTLKEQIAHDWANLATYLAGRPMNPAPTDQTTIADNGGRAAQSRTPINWTTGYM